MTPRSLVSSSSPPAIQCFVQQESATEGDRRVARNTDATWSGGQCQKIKNQKSKNQNQNADAKLKLQWSP